MLSNNLPIQNSPVTIIPYLKKQQLSISVATSFLSSLANAQAGLGKNRLLAVSAMSYMISEL
jgi:hypothetical protein